MNLGLSEEPEKRKFRSKHTALLSLLERDLTKKEYMSESAILNKIKKMGYDFKQIYHVWNYYKSSGREFNSFKIFLWENGKLIKECLPLIKISEKETKPKMDNCDYRESKPQAKPEAKTLFQFLNE